MVFDHIQFYEIKLFSKKYSIIFCLIMVTYYQSSISSPGSVTMACWIMGADGNPGDTTESFMEESNLEQVITK